MTQKNIKEITNKQPAFSLRFQVIKKMVQQQSSTIYQISDETGTCKLRIKSQLTKFIQEGKVYTGHSLVPVLKDDKIILELAMNVGSLTKQPDVLPFKDHTFDLSEVEWKQVKEVKEEPKVETKHQGKIELTESESSQAQSQKVEKKYESKQKPSNKGQYNNKQFEKNKSKYVLKQETTYDEKQRDKQRQKKYTSKPSFIKLINLKQFSQKQLVDVIVQVSNIKQIQKLLSGQWKRFIQCTMADNTGSAIGSFFPQNHLKDGEYYEFRNLKVKYVKGVLHLMEGKETSKKINYSANFKPKFSPVQINDKY